MRTLGSEAGSCRNVVLSGFFVMRVSTVLSSRSALFVVDALESEGMKGLEHWGLFSSRPEPL